MKILFLSFKREDIGVAMVTNMISQLQESSPLWKRTLHGHLGIRIFSRAESISHSKIKFVSPRGHVIPFMYYSPALPIRTATSRVPITHESRGKNIPLFDVICLVHEEELGKPYNFTTRFTVRNLNSIDRYKG